MIYGTIYLMDLFDGIDLDDVPVSYNKPPVNPEYDDPGGDWDEYENLDVKEQQEKIRKLQIGNEKELRNLVEKDLIIAIIGEVGQSIQNNLVDQAKRKAYLWANKLGITEKERDIEKLIGEMVKEGIQGVKMDIERLISEKTFE